MIIINNNGTHLRARQNKVSVIGFLIFLFPERFVFIRLRQKTMNIKISNYINCFNFLYKQAKSSFSCFSTSLSTFSGIINVFHTDPVLCYFSDFSSFTPPDDKPDLLSGFHNVFSFCNKAWVI